MAKPVLLATTRRDFLKYVMAGSTTLVVGGLVMPRARAQVPEIPDLFDVGDFLIAAEAAYADNLVLEVTSHNRVRFELPRLDKGQGILTAMAMLIADLMDADYERTDVVLSDARADRPYSLTGYSSTMRAMWEWVPSLAAEARARLITAAADRWGADANALVAKNSMVFAPDGRAASFGELSAEAAAVLLPAVSTTPKSVSELTLVGTPRGRKNARELVTGQQQYTLDLDLPGALHAVVARPPDIYGSVASWDGTAAEAMPHVSGTAEIPQIFETSGVGRLEGGVAVAARTFHEAFQGRDALQISWNAGPLAGVSDANLRDQLVTNALPLLPPLGTSSIDASFEFPYVNHAPLEVQTAAARVDMEAGTAEVWFASQAPLYTAQVVAEAIGVPEANVTLHVTPCGGSFGRHLFSEAAIEAAIVAKEVGAPIKLMWSRNDDMRNGRFRPMSHHELRASWDDLLGISSYEHNVSAAETDFRHGMGDIISAAGFDLGSTPSGQAVFEGSVTLPYDFTVKDQKIVETILPVPTCSWRSIYSGFTITCNEIFVDEIARAQGVDEVAFRMQHLTDERAKACLQHVATAGDWGGSLPAGHFQGVATHVEYRSAVAYLVQVDASDPADPRLVAAWVAVDVGVPINPKGLEAQLQGALIDGWSVMFRAGNTLQNGTIVQGSYGDFHWARMNHAPFTTNVHVFPASPPNAEGDPRPGGCGELGLPPSSAACVNAYARATGTAHRQFPILEIS